MTVFIHEMKRNFKSLLIWSFSVAGMLALCVFMFPEMETQMSDVSEMFSSMGAFTSAFGLDKINFGTLIGYYAIECGNILGFGGAFYAAYIGVSMLAKEESGHTSEFLLMHPLSRSSIVLSKLSATMVYVLAFNALSLIASLVSFAAIGEYPPWKAFFLFLLAQLLMQIEIAALSFGVSAFVKRGALGMGLGSVTMLYFLNIFGNISEKADFVRYITPFTYADAANIIYDVHLETKLIVLGAVYSVVAIAAAFIHYNKKDMIA